MVHLVIIFSAKYLFLLSIIIAGVYFIKANKGIKKSTLLLGLISLPISYFVAKISALFIKDPRPFVVEHIKPLIAHAPDNGFPSDHTLLTMAIASVIFAYNRKVGTILFIIALIVGISRILAKVHHPLDIIGSTVIAVSITALVRYFLRHFSKGLESQPASHKKIQA